MNWKENFENGKQLVLATASVDGAPNANIVVSLGFVDDKLLIADCQMDRTINNLRENNLICVVGSYFRIKGSVEIFPSGKYFDLCNEGNSEECKAKNAILITVKEVFNLDKVEVLNL